MSRKELEAVLDYIMNRADPAEFEVIQKACQRRAADRSALGRLDGLGPAGSAKKLAQDLQDQMGYSLGGIRTMVRDYVAEIVRKNAPEISEEELEAVLGAYLPEPGAETSFLSETPAAPGPASPLPPEAQLSMVRQFVEFSEGRMAPSRQRELWEENPRWKEAYWAAFSPELKALVKGYLDGKLDGDSFGTAILSVLGL